MLAETVQPPSVSGSAPPDDPRQSHAAGFGWLLALITAIAAALRLHTVAVKPLWLDEAFSAEIARLHWPDFFLALFNREVNMSFYYFLLYFWMKLGSTEGYIRGLSVVFSVGTIPMMYLLGTRLFNRRVGLLAAWLLALNAYHIQYAQQARSYALLMFLAVLAAWLLVRNLQNPSTARWGPYTAVCVAIVYTHLYGALLVIAHVASLAFLNRNDVPWRKVLRSLGLFALPMFPLAVDVLGIGIGPLNWVPQINVATVLSFLMQFSGDYGWPLLGLETIGLVLAAFAWWREYQARGKSISGWAYALVIVWLILPVLLVLVACLVRPLFMPQYVSFCLPALILAVAAGICDLRPRAFAWTLTAVISLLSVFGTTLYYPKGSDLGGDDWRVASSYVFENARPGDSVVFYINFGRLPFEYYRSRQHPNPVWPEYVVQAYGPGVTYHDFVFENVGEELRDAKPAGDRVWLVLYQDQDSSGQPNRASVVLHAVFAKGRHLALERKFSELTILLYARDPGDHSQLAFQ